MPKTYNAERPDQLLLAYENESYKTKGQEAARIYMRHSPCICTIGPIGEGNRMNVTTQDCERAILELGIASLGFETSSLGHVTTNQFYEQSTSLVHHESSSLFCSLVSDEGSSLVCSPVYDKCT